MTDAAPNVPLPPPGLADRVLGDDRTDPAYDPVAAFDSGGAAAKQTILDLVGPEYSFAGRRVLDFGCGAGKILRHFLAQAETAEFYGCDIDTPSISWLQRNLSPPLHVFVNDAEPPLPLPDSHFDLIVANSVFTHLTDHWSSWLIELHRVLKDGGLVIASFMGAGMGEAIAREPWAEDQTGMTVFEYGENFADGRQGPMVLHSHWWIREHWGRLFEIELLLDDAPGEQGIVLLRKKNVALGSSELERVDPGEPRELRAALRQIRHLKRELTSMRDKLDAETRRRRELESVPRPPRQSGETTSSGAGTKDSSPPAATEGWLRRFAQRLAVRAQLALGISAVISAIQGVIDRVDGLAQTAGVLRSTTDDEVISPLAALTEPASAPPDGTAATTAPSLGARDFRDVPPIWPGSEHLIPPRKLWVMPDLSWLDFFRWPVEYFAYLTLLCDLRADSSVLEVGCQSGRTMLALLYHLRPPGRYEGLDVSREHVAFAQAAMGGNNSIFNFRAIDVYHSWYNPSGGLDPSTVRLPYDDQSFDVAYAASVFTHQLPSATQNYFRESARMLKPGGRCLFSFLALDHHDAAVAIGASPMFDLSYRLPEIPGVGLGDPDYPDRFVAYEVRLIAELADAAGLRLERLLPGTWSGSQAYAVNDHELALLVKD